jgi:hypothetical protein
MVRHALRLFLDAQEKDGMQLLSRRDVDLFARKPNSDIPEKI